MIERSGMRLTMWAAMGAALSLATGCTVLLAPDRDAIIDIDAGRDAGMDATVDGEVDGGPDAGDAGDGGDAGCLDPQVEICTGGEDEDCDGFSDCNDFDCQSAAHCCIADTGTGQPAEFGSTFWTSMPEAGGPSLSTAGVTFSGRGAAVLNRCVPLAYGARFELTFHIGGLDNEDFAAFALGPVAGIDGSRTFLSDLSVTVRARDTAALIVERAGTPIGDPVDLGAGDTTVFVLVNPGVDSAGRAVLSATVTTGTGESIIADEPIMPLSDLRGAAAGCTPDGLYAAIVGRGDDVTVGGPGLEIDLFECPNPQQFMPDTALTPSQPLAEALPVGVWRMGGVGEPTLTEARTGLSAASNTLEFWADGSQQPRSTEIILPPDYASNGARWVGNAADGPWEAREQGLLQHGAREPSVLAVVGDDEVALPVRYLASAVPDTDGDGYDLQLQVFNSAINTTTISELLTIERVGGCTSLRDPSLVSLDGAAHLMVLFTCEHGAAPSTIGAAVLAQESDEEYGLTAQTDDVFNGAPPPAYAFGGVSSPEVVVGRLRDDGTLPLRMWYLARGDSTTVAFAFAALGAEEAAMDGGVGRDGGLPAHIGLPHFAPFAGNPVLAGNHPLLGSEETCVRGCDIESLAVLDTTNDGLWPDPVYLLLVDRTRYDPAGQAIHELVGLTQARFDD